jgi:hypothetical protein
MLWSMLTMAACVIRVNILCLRLCDSVVAGYIRRRIEFVVCRELQFYLNWFLNFEWCLRLWHTCDLFWQRPQPSTAFGGMCCFEQ